jgi:hypothetical protein
MSWQPLEQMPDEAQAGSARGVGPFRQQAEPVVALRTGPTLRERARLFFGSTPDLPSARAGRRLLLTHEHLYVERADGTKERVRRADLRGRREERGRVIYGVRDGEDLALLERGYCPVMAALDQQLEQQAEAVETHLGFVSAAKRVAVAICLGAVLALRLDRLGQGWHFVENPKQLLILIPIGLFLHALFLRPERLRVDKLGLHRRFGVLPLFHENIDPEDIEEVVVENHHLRGELVGLQVTLVRRGPNALPGKRRGVVLETYDTRSWGKVASSTIAHDMAERVAELLGVPMHDLSTH